jgi:cytosine deaminase
MHLFRRARIPLACLPCLVAGASRRAGCASGTLGGVRRHDRGASHRLRDALRHRRGCNAATAAIGVTDLHGVIVLPGLLDVHTHLDKAHTWHRAPNPTGEFWDAIKALGDDSRRWTEADIYRRANFALRSAHAHGTNALRSHIDTGAGAVGEPGHAALQQLRHEWQGRIHLQTVSLCNLSAFAQGDAHRIVELTARYGATALGGFPQPNPDLPRQYDALMAAARELGIGLDLHVDESGLAHAECLRAAAEAVLRNQFPLPGRVRSQLLARHPGSVTRRQHPRTRARGRPAHHFPAALQSLPAGARTGAGRRHHPGPRSAADPALAGHHAAP